MTWRGATDVHLLGKPDNRQTVDACGRVSGHLASVIIVFAEVIHHGDRLFHVPNSLTSIRSVVPRKEDRTNCS
jgi:hypothetical protein